jgi:hypothetical protein
MRDFPPALQVGIQGLNPEINIMLLSYKIKSKLLWQARIFFAAWVLKVNYAPGAYIAVREEAGFDFRFQDTEKRPAGRVVTI